MQREKKKTVRTKRRQNHGRQKRRMQLLFQIRFSVVLLFQLIWQNATSKQPDYLIIS